MTQDCRIAEAALWRLVQRETARVAAAVRRAGAIYDRIAELEDRAMAASEWALGERSYPASYAPAGAVAGRYYPALHRAEEIAERRRERLAALRESLRRLECAA